MPKFTSYPAGTPCWVDLITPDLDASKAFYSAVFGWKAESQEDGGEVIYTLFQLDGQNIAGMSAQGPNMAGMPPIWNSYVAVDDVAATVAAAEGAGGSVMMPPMQVMSAGEMAVIGDPTGAGISLWKAGDHIGADVCNEPDTYSWNELMTSDPAKAKEFYTAVFGWNYDEMDMGDAGVYTVIAGGENGGLGGIMGRPAEVPAEIPDHWAVYFTVADVDASIDKAKNNGGQVLNGPMDIPGVGRLAVIADPIGGTFSMMQPGG